ncbi:MAG: hypothetical protein QNJ14_04210 [Woeseiaceae bacterium]|nr:hypothetical protein [Woeseiaceae bacterium]
MADLPFEIPDYLKARFEADLRREYASEPLFDYYELSLFKWHLQETENLNKRMHDAALQYIREQVDNDVDIVNDSGMLPVEYFYRRVRYSDVVFMVSLLESLLEKACMRLRQLLPRVDMPENFSGGKWRGPQQFLERYGEVQTPENLWEPVKRLIDVRNLIVHDNGSAEPLGDDGRKELSKCAGLSIKGGRVEVSPEYVERAIDDIELLIQHYEEGIRQTVERADSELK